MRYFWEVTFVVVVYVLLFIMMLLAIGEVAYADDYELIGTPIGVNVTEDVTVSEYVYIYANIDFDEDLQIYLYEQCEENGVNFDITVAMIALESEWQFQDYICSETNDWGIMNLHAKYRRWHSELAEVEEIDYRNPYQNIKVGVRILAYGYDVGRRRGYEGKTLDIYALNVYNMGVGGYDKYIARTGVMSRAYDRVVFKNLEKIK